MNAAELKETASRFGRPDLPWDKAIDVLATCEHVGPQALAEAGIEMRDALTCLLLLSGEPTYATKAQWYFEQFELSGRDVAKAVDDKAFVHPVTRENVEDFESKIFITYSRDQLEKETNAY